uniref:Uncharacterized protein n=1 Tax=Timema bartmani TaxID=61472 RepID=A0A7R9F585_9NEOP|nr:unnamed protein product [Timema bartmani]
MSDVEGGTLPGLTEEEHPPGRGGKPHGYALCVLDYEFQILDNAFLVHKPGIKTLKKDPQRAMLSSKTNALIKKESDIDELNNSDHDSESEQASEEANHPPNFGPHKVLVAT